MTAAQFFLPFPTAFSSNGLPVSGAKIYFYATRTTTPQAIYSDAALTVPLTNPVVANAAGRFSTIYLDSTLTYRVVVKDENDVSLGVDVDPYIPGITSAVITAATGTAVNSRSSLAAVTNPAAGQFATLLESGREGTFVFQSGDLSTQVTNDPLQGVYVAPSSAPTGASGAWVRQDKVLRPEMWGISGTDNLTALRNAGYWACQLNRPLESGGSSYWLTGPWYIGSRTGSAPSANTANGIELRGRWNFVCDAPSDDPFVILQNGYGATIGDLDFDIVTGSPTSGHGQLRLVDFGGVHCGHLTKIGTSAMAATYLTSGGSVLSINGLCPDVSWESAIVEHAGNAASATFASFTASGNPSGLRGTYQRCIAGQDACDFSGVDGFWLGEIYGKDLEEVFDCGNSSNGYVDFIHGRNCQFGMTAKTEASGGTHKGSNNIHISRMEMSDWTGAIFRMSAGATTTQTLHNIKIGSMTGKTTVATGTTRAIITAAGDDTADPTRGFEVNSGDVQMNAGTAIEHQNGLTQYRISNFRCTAPTPMLDNTPGSFTTPNKGLYENCEFTGDFTIGHDYTTFRNVTVSGVFTAQEGYGNRYDSVTAKAFDLQWNTGGANYKDIVVDNCRSVNAAARAIRVRCVGAVGTIQGVRLHRFEAIDTQGSPTSTGYAFENATFDHCEMRDCRAQNLADNGSWGFEGLNSVNSNNRLRDPVEVVFGGLTVSMLHAGRRIVQSSGGTITVPANSTTVFPLGTEIEIEDDNGGGTVVAGAGGVTVRSLAADLTLAGRYAVGKLRKIAADTWSYTGQL